MGINLNLQQETLFITHSSLFSTHKLALLQIIVLRVHEVTASCGYQQQLAVVANNSLLWVIVTTGCG
jgi:hypothetical protein